MTPDTNPDPVLAETKEPGWGWYAGWNEEEMTIGPEDSREAVIQIAIDDEVGYREADEDGPERLCFHIIEARQDTLIIAEYIDVGRMVERWEESDWEEMTNPNDPRSPVEKVTKAQWDDLQDRLRAAALQWQTDHAIKIKPWTFSQVRNSEDVSIPYSEETAP